MESIVKVQLAQFPAEAPAMIYDKDRMHTEYRKLGRADLKVMGKDAKVYRQAKWETRTRRWLLGDRVVSQNW